MTEPVDIAGNQTLDQQFRLGTLLIDPRACEAVGPGGSERLDPKVMDVLVMLAEHAGAVVLREDLLARLWPHVVVTDEALSRCIYELRRHLSQAGGSPRYREMIETLPKRGYRLTGAIVPITPQPPPSQFKLLKKTRIAATFATFVVIVLAVIVGQQMVKSSVESDLLTTQDEIAETLATAIPVTLSAETSEARMPASFEAHENYLQGEYFYNRRALGDVERSVHYFQEAVAVDPHYAKAWAALAGAYSYMALSGTEVDKELQRLQGEAALRAVELDPKLAIAHARLSQFYDDTTQTAKAVEHDRIARALSPNEPLSMGNASEAAFRSGDVPQAIAIQRRLVAQDPLNSFNRQNLGVLLIAAGQLDEALKEYRYLLEMRQDAGPDIEIEIPRILVLQGRATEAHTAALRLPEGRFRDQALALLYRAPAYRAYADAALARLSERRYAEAESIGDDIMFNIRLAEVRAFRGASDHAFATLTQKKNALVEHWGKDAAISRYHAHEAALSPFLKSLHADPRWLEFMAESR